MQVKYKNSVFWQLFFPCGGLVASGLALLLGSEAGDNVITDRRWAGGVLGWLHLWAMLGGGWASNALPFLLAPLGPSLEDCQDSSLT